MIFIPNYIQGADTGTRNDLVITVYSNMQGFFLGNIYLHRGEGGSCG